MNARARILLWAALPAAITMVVYLPALTNGFVTWDDLSYVHDRLQIRSLNGSFLQWAFTTSFLSNWHPLTWISYALDYRLWGLSPGGYHLTSVLLHTLNTYLVMVMVLYLLRSAASAQNDASAERVRLSVAIGTALLFGLHPIHVESVAWIAERKDVLCAFFFLLSINTYLRYARSSAAGGRFYLQKDYWLVVLLFCLSLLSKQMSITLPAVLLILDWYPLRRLEDKGKRLAVIAEKLPLVLLSVIVSIVVIALQEPFKTIGLNELSLQLRWLNAIVAIMKYLWHTLLPVGLVPLYPYRPLSFLSPVSLASAAVVVVLSAGAFYFRKKVPVLAACWLYTVITLAPVIGVIQVGRQAMADRYFYLPSLGILLLISLLGVRLLARAAGPLHRSRRVIIIAVYAMGLLVLSSLTVKQIGYWKDGIILWTRQLDAVPADEQDPKWMALAYTNRATEYARKKEFAHAFEDSQRALLLEPTALRHLNFALVIMAMGDENNAFTHLSRAIDLDPDEAVDAFAHRGKLHEKKGLLVNALRDYTAYIGLKGEVSEVLTDALIRRGALFARFGKDDEAVTDLGSAIDQLSRTGNGCAQPLSDLRYNRANALARLGRYEEAVREYDDAIRCDPHPDYSRNRSRAVERLTERQGAVSRPPR